jgi:hypothetical protein
VNALAWDDEGCRAWGCIEAAAVKSESSDDHDEQCDDGDQVDLAGIGTPVIVIAVADFPAHDWPPGGSIRSMRVQGSGSPRGSNADSLGSAAAIALPV